MAIIKFICPGETKYTLWKVINYIINPEKTEPDLIGGHNCYPDHVFEQFMATKEIFGKLDKRQYLHFTQSFADYEQVPFHIAKEIADKLVQFADFQGFQVFYAVHTDRQHTHTHFIINSVSLDDGRKWQQPKSQLKALKAYSDQLCREYGLQECPRHWKFRLFTTVKDALKYSRSWEEFFSGAWGRGL